MKPIQVFDDCLNIQEGQLFIEECSLSEIAIKFGTPLFVVSEKQIRENYREIKKAFTDNWPEGKVEILPAIKAAPITAIRKILSEEGAGCDVFGMSELEGAIRGGTDPQKISVNGSIKDKKIIQKAILIGATLVLDAPRELDICIAEAKSLGKIARVMLRLKPFLKDLETNSDFGVGSIQETTQTIKYGIPTNEVRPMVATANLSKHTELVGYHCHIGRHSRDVKVWESLVDNYIDLIGEFSRENQNFIPKIIDFGGGFPSPRDYDSDVPTKFDTPAPKINYYAKALCERLRVALKRNKVSAKGLAIEIEPGRSLHANTGVHLTQVVNLKRNTGPVECYWAETDTSEFFLGVPGLALYDAPFNMSVTNKALDTKFEPVDIVGRSCGLELLAKNIELPILETGDTIAFLDTGAYVESCGCNFNAMPRPGIVLVSGKSANWIRTPETIEDIYARDVMPEHIV